MPSEVTARQHNVLRAETLAQLDAYWVGVPFFAAQRRRYELELKVRVEFAARGDKPAPWVIEEIRSGEWERRTKRNMQNLLRHRARLASLKQAGWRASSRPATASTLSIVLSPRR
jgi:hypothetical protein